MKYFITEYKNNETKDSLRTLGLYCYSLRTANGWNEIATIENNVLINLYGSIITNEEIKLGEEYPNDFIDYKEFILNNEKVDSIFELKDNLVDKGKIDLSDDKFINKKFSVLFRKKRNYQKLKKMKPKTKLKYIEKYFNNTDDYRLIDFGGHIYQLFYIAKSKEV